MSGDASVSAFPDNDNLFKWIGTITGPAATVRHAQQSLSAVVMQCRCTRA